MTTATAPIVGDALILKYDQERRQPFGHLIIFDESETVDEVLKKMTGHKIIAAPVCFVTNRGKRYTMVDLASIALAIIENEDNLKIPVRDILGSAEQTLPIEETSPLSSAISTLGQGLFHRLVVIRDEKPYQLLSQMDIIWYYKKHFDKVSKLHVKDLMIRNPLSLNGNVITKEGLKQIVGNCIAGVAVLNEHGKIYANFSVSDLRGLDKERMKKLLNLPLNQFLKETKGALLKDPITLKENDTLSDVIKCMQQHHIHRVHIVDNTNQVIGIVTSTDVMKAISS